ncbi:MAG: M15 family metallopeptidase [Muribaculaceae bacterium]|nr:M15 family metallopeptidase [Muribaculaceae bacterium]
MKIQSLILASVLACTTMSSHGKMLFSDDNSGFVMLAEAVPEVILEPRYYSTYNFVGTRIDGYEEPCMLITREAAFALREVAKDLLERGYRLKVWDSYRPQCGVDHFARWAKDLNDTTMRPYFYPKVDKSVLFEQEYIAYHSGHTRGSTVDLTLFDMRTGKEVDMGGTFDYFGVESHPTFKKGLTEQQYANRMLLRQVMMAHGFKPITTEWWHFTLATEPYPNTYFTFPVKTKQDARCETQEP